MKITTLKRLFCPLLALTLAPVFSFPARADSPPKAEPWVIKFGTMAPANSAWTEMPDKLILPIINEMFGQKLKLRIYYGGVHGDDEEILRKMDRGELDACCCTNQGTMQAVPELSVLSLPMLFRSYDEVDYIVSQLRRYMESLFQKRGYKLLFLVDTGFLYFFSHDDPSSLEKIRRQKVFTWFGEIQERTFNSLGITPIPITVPELAPSIISGRTNSGTGPASWLLATQMYSHMKFVLNPPFFYGPSTGFIAQDRLNEIINNLADDPRKFQDFQQAFASFKNRLAAEPYLRNMGIKNESFLEAGREIISWVENQNIENPTDVIEMIFGVFQKAESAWLRSIRIFEAECLRGFYRRGMKKVDLVQSDYPFLLLSTRKIWDEYAGTLYPKKLLEGIRTRLLEYRTEKKETANSS